MPRGLSLSSNTDQLIKSNRGHYETTKNDYNKEVTSRNGTNTNKWGISTKSTRHVPLTADPREKNTQIWAHPRCKNLLPSRVAKKEVKTIDRTNIIVTKQRKTSQV